MRYCDVVMVIGKIYFECKAVKPNLFTLFDIVYIGWPVLDVIALLEPSIALFFVFLRGEESWLHALLEE